ncbi:MAG: hypothetical protein RJA63_1442 [Pseudomonadota bacterium]|jgi:hypothetical protein
MVGGELIEPESSVDETLAQALQLLDGDGVEPDYTRAYSMLNSVAESGRPDVLRALASTYREGLGVAQDVQQALALLEPLAEQGDFLSCIELARIHAERERSQGGPAQAARWYRQALSLPDAAQHPEAAQEARSYRLYAGGRGVADLAVCPHCEGLFDRQYAVRLQSQPWYRLAKSYCQCPTCKSELTYKHEFSPRDEALVSWGHSAPLFLLVIVFSGSLNQASLGLRLLIMGLISIPVLAGWRASQKGAGHYVVSTADTKLAALAAPILFVKAIQIWIVQRFFELVPLAMLEGLLLFQWIHDVGVRLLVHNLCSAAATFMVAWFMLPTCGLLTRRHCGFIGMGWAAATIVLTFAAVGSPPGAHVPWAKHLGSEGWLMPWCATIITSLVTPYLVATWRKILLTPV